MSNHNIPQIEQTCIWDAADGRKLVGFAESFCGLSADGRWLALAGDNNIQLRHTDSGRLQATVPWCHFRGFSPDGSLLVANDDTCHELGVWEVTTGRLLRKWRDPGLKFQHASYSPDGRTVLAATDHGTMLLYDATGLASAPGELPSFKLTASDIDRLWKDLGSTDGTRIHQAIWALAAGGDATVKGLQKRLQPVQRLDPKLAAELLGNLDSDRYAIREKAMTQLQRLENAQPVLEDVLTKQPTLEMRLRIELILGKLPELPWDDELLRNCRAVAVLEQIGTPHAREVLAGLSAGFPQARLTKAARAALERLTRK